jgi:hypothetical protein
VLAELAGQGRDHLCIIPNQGLHVAPWHLYGWDGTQLADYWIVTLLPHPHPLFSGRGALTVVGRQSLPVLSVGVAHSMPAPDLPVLTDACDEAVANRLGGRPDTVAVGAVGGSFRGGSVKRGARGCDGRVGRPWPGSSTSRRWPGTVAGHYRPARP